MKIIYPRTKAKDVDAAAEQLLNGRVKIYEETIFKDLPVENSKKALQKYQGRRDFHDKCDTILNVGCAGGVGALMLGGLFLPNTLGFVVIGGLVSIFASFGVKLLGYIVYKLPDYQIRRKHITNVSWSDGDETRFSIFEYGSGDEYYFPDKKSYEKAKQCIQESEDIIKSSDELFWLIQKLKGVGNSLRRINNIRNFINDCGGKVDITVFPTDIGYQMQVKENDMESNSDNGKIKIKGREFSIVLSKTDFKKIFAKEGVIDFSYLDGDTEGCVKDIYDWSGKTMPVLKDKMPLLPDKLAQETAECEIVEI